MLKKSLYFTVAAALMAIRADSSLVELSVSPSSPTVTLSVPTNTAARVVDYFGPSTPKDYALSFDITRKIGRSTGHLSSPSTLMGPCEISMKWTSAIDPNIGIYFAIIELFDTSSKSPSISLTLQSSTNLSSSNWVPASAFFRAVEKK